MSAAPKVASGPNGLAIDAINPPAARFGYEFFINSGLASLIHFSCDSNNASSASCSATVGVISPLFFILS